MSYVEQTFKEAGITPAELKADPSLIRRLVEVGMKITRGQANPDLLEFELREWAKEHD